jgi:DNA polymerase-1
MTASPDLVLVDGSSYVYRAYHALPTRLSNAQGEPTGAVLVVLNMLQKFMKDFQPRHIAVVFDAPGRTFRDDLFAEYKAHRPTMPDDLRAQIEPVLNIIRAQGLPLLRVPGVEADDVIGTLACRAAKAGQSVLISTGDKDMAQLVNESITLINTMTNATLDRAGVKAKFDVFPEQIIDYLALIGDSSDNIPGIDKVGPKTGAKLLQQFGSLDGLVARVAEVPGKVGDNLRAGLATLELSRRLATINTDLELPLTIDELAPGTPDVAALRELYTRYELRALLRQLDGEDGATASDAQPPPAPAAAAPSAGPVIERRYETITTPEQLQRWLAILRAAPLFAFDTETTSPDYMQAQIVGVAFSVEPGVAAYVPFGHVYAGAPEQLSREAVLAALRQGGAQPQVRRPRAEERRHRAGWHALRHHARVVRVE